MLHNHHHHRQSSSLYLHSPFISDACSDSRASWWEDRGVFWTEHMVQCKKKSFPWSHSLTTPHPKVYSSQISPQTLACTGTFSLKCLNSFASCFYLSFRCWLLRLWVLFASSSGKDMYSHTSKRVCKKEGVDHYGINLIKLVLYIVTFHYFVPMSWFPSLLSSRRTLLSAILQSCLVLLLCFQKSLDVRWRWVDWCSSQDSSSWLNAFARHILHFPHEPVPDCRILSNATLPPTMALLWIRQCKLLLCSYVGDGGGTDWLAHRHDSCNGVSRGCSFGWEWVIQTSQTWNFDSMIFFSTIDFNLILKCHIRINCKKNQLQNPSRQPLRSPLLQHWRLIRYAPLALHRS